MIFLIVFGLIALIVIVLNMMDNSNLEKIENYFKSQNCQNIVYSKGVFKGICENKVMQISNGFSVDIDKNKTVFDFKDIKKIEEKNSKIIINETYNIEFKEKENLDKFYKILKEKTNK